MSAEKSSRGSGLLVHRVVAQSLQVEAAYRHTPRPFASFSFALQIKHLTTAPKLSGSVPDLNRLQLLGKGAPVLHPYFVGSLALSGRKVSTLTLP